MNGGGWTRRARPLLGTLVEVGANAPPDVVAAAFDAVAAVQQALSRFEPGSDVARFNALPAGGEVVVGPHAGTVLEAAAALSLDSGGAFDVALGSGRWRLDGDRLRKLDPGTRLDLGGIAKGHAVDAAVQALRSQGTTSGWVNAGGDVRAFGSARLAIALRDEAHGGVRRFGTLCDAAFATSHFAPGSRSALAGGGAVPRHVSVRAPRAIWADALTKLAALGGYGAVLARHGAKAWVH